MLPSGPTSALTISPGAWQTAGAIGSAAVAGGLSYLGGRATNEANAEEARLNREFQERMSNTAYQRSVADMRLAGINPMVAYMQGGASSPGGAQATMQDAVSPAVSSAMHAMRLRADMQLLRDQQQKVRAEANREHAQSQYWWKMNERADRENQLGYAEAAVAGLRSQSAAALAAARSSGARARIEELQIPGYENIARIEGGDVGQAGAWIKYILQTIRGRR